jgi:hypothetical protein
MEVKGVGKLAKIYFCSFSPTSFLPPKTFSKKRYSKYLLNISRRECLGTDLLFELTWATSP